MKKFMALYLAPVEMMRKMMAETTPETMKAGMDVWMKWAEANKTAIIDIGTPMGKNKRVSKAGIKDQSNELTGYSIIEAESHDAAAAIFKDHPHLQMDGAYIEVAECVQVPGM